MSVPPLKRGPRPRHYTTPAGEVVHGLTRMADGRWRVRSVLGRDVVYTEPDPEKAVERFRAMLVDVKTWGETAPIAAVREPAPHDVEHVHGRRVHLVQSAGSADAALWAWVRHSILSDPSFAARGLGVDPSALDDLRAALARGQ